MSDTEFDTIVENYFRQLEVLLLPISRDRREQLIDELRDHVNQARSALTVESAAAIYEIFERIGSPEEIAREELRDQSPRWPMARLRRVRQALNGAPSITEGRWEWIGASAGLLFVLCFLVSKLMVPNAPSVGAPAATVADYFSANAHSLIASGLIGTVGALIFLIFLGVARTGFLSASRDGAVLASVLLASGTAFALMGMLAALVTTTLAILANQSPGNLPAASYVSALYVLRTVSGIGLFGLVAAVMIGALGMALAAARFIGGILGLVFLAIGVVNAAGGGAALVMGSYSTTWMVVQTISTFGIAFVILTASVVLALRALPVADSLQESEGRGALGSLKRRLGLDRVTTSGRWLSGIAIAAALAVAASIAVPLATHATNNDVLLASTTGSSSPSGSSSASVGYDGPAICAPTTDAATSGGSPKALLDSATKVAGGVIEGKPWSLWSAKGKTGAAGLEDGGVVFDGREYGLCAGYPNPSESEMIDTGGDAIIYGVVDYPGLAKVQVSTGTLNSLSVGTVLPSPHVMVVNGLSFYIGALPKSACSYTYFEVNTTSRSYSTEHNIGFGKSGAGQGYSITNNPGNTGACVTGKLDPLSYSEGVWQLPPGQFQGDATESGGSGSGSGSGTASVNVPNDTSDCSPTTDPSTSGAAASTLTSTGTEVANGTIEGEDWSLWSAQGQSGATGLEDGGLDLGGRAYGLCPGYPNPAELEMIDTTSGAVVAGVVGYPGLATVSLYESSAGTFDSSTQLPSPSVQVVDGVSFFIGTLPESACDYSSLELNTTSPGVSAEHNLGFGNCVSNELVPITESQGQWQLAAGQFPTGF